MKSISLETLATLNKDNFMRKCCLCFSSHVQYHHALIFSGQRCDDPETILPLCPNCHSKEKERNINDKLSWIMLNRMTQEQINKYSKVVNLSEKRKKLNEQFGKF